jgi:hypothetical protein
VTEPSVVPAVTVSVTSNFTPFAAKAVESKYTRNIKPNLVDVDISTETTGTTKSSTRKQYLDDAMKNFDPTTFRSRNKSVNKENAGTINAEKDEKEPSAANARQKAVPKNQLVISESDSPVLSTAIPLLSKRRSRDSDDTSSTTTTASDNDATATGTATATVAGAPALKKSSTRADADDEDSIVIVNLKTAGGKKRTISAKNETPRGLSGSFGFDISVVDVYSNDNRAPDPTAVASDMVPEPLAKLNKKKRVSFAGNDKPDLQNTLNSINSGENLTNHTNGSIAAGATSTTTIAIPMRKTKSANSAVPSASVLATASTTAVALSSKLDASFQLMYTCPSSGSDYYNLGLLGKGGSSSVYRVLNRKDNQLYAYKRVDVNKHSNDEAGGGVGVFESYINEMNVLKRLQGSDYIIRLVDCSINEQEMCINMIMEMGEVDLARLLSQKQKQLLQINSSYNNNMHGSTATPAVVGDGGHSISNPFFARMVWQEMLQAVDYIHQHNVVHGKV